MTAAGRSPQHAGASIGSVLARLRVEFPDVTISKIRFLESEGLVSPERTAAGYRQFSPADVERLRFVLAAQRDRYLPLKVIKEQLDSMDRGGEPGQSVAIRGPRPLIGLVDDGVRVDDFASPEVVRMTQEELLAEAGITVTMLAQLEQYGVIRPGPAGFYDADAVVLARTAREMTEFGLEARHLRAFRASADREVGLLSQIVAPVSRKRDPDAQAKADEVVRELAVLSVRMHALLVKTGLRGVTGR
ncbi:MAG: transcriptional regulator FtsR [Pseudonocardiaceae bacterium]